jgi:small subunit ribosomal protein S6
MPFYENIFIARQDVSSAQVEALADSFATLVGEQGGQVTKREYWGLRNLSYRIKKNRKGHYMFFNLDAPPAAVNELERNMRINEDVIRYLTVRVEALEEGPSVVMQSRSRGEERERERGRRGYGEREREEAPRAPEGGEE